MALKQRLAQRFGTALAIAGCFATGLTTAVVAQSGPGLTIFSGIDREYELGYHLDYEGISNRYDNYHLRVPADKLELAVSQFAVTYPDTYEVNFDVEDVEIRLEVDGESVPLDSVSWDVDNRIIEIFPTDPVPARSDVEIVLKDIRNPGGSGIHYFNCLIRSAGDVPMLRYVGTWIINIGRG
jgi:hypothetical protein